MSQIYRQKPGIPARNVEGVMAVITPHSSEIHRLNETGAVIWERCGEGATRDELIEALQARYEADREVLGHDVDAFLEEATRKGILITSP